MDFKFNITKGFKTDKERDFSDIRSNSLVTKICKNCGKEFVVPRWYGTGDYCSKKCSDASKMAKPNVKCAICGREFHLKESVIKKSKTGLFCCSKQCVGKLRSRIYLGENNPNYRNNSLSYYYNNGYKYQQIKIHDFHPYKNKGNYYPYHRYVIEQNHEMFDNSYFNIINDNFYLKPEISVHHIDKNTLNNDINNLIPLSRSEHTTMHNKEKEIIRDKLGRITGVFKRGELLENHNDNDNQQPSNNRNIIEGSTTNTRILPDKAEDSNGNTSAPPSIKFIFKKK